jgi:hypothetical protein
VESLLLYLGETTLSTWSESEEIKAEQITAWEVVLLY